MIFFEPQSRDRKIFPHDPFKALVTPRPNAFSSNPPIVGFSVLGRVVGIYVDERFVRQGRVDAAAMRPVARGGSMPRPA